MLGKGDIHRANDASKAVLDHPPRAIAELVRRLEQHHQGAVPAILVSGEQTCGTEQAGDVHVVSHACITGTSAPVSSVAVTVLA